MSSVSLTKYVSTKDKYCKGAGNLNTSMLVYYPPKTNAYGFYFNNQPSNFYIDSNLPNESRLRDEVKYDLTFSNNPYSASAYPDNMYMQPPGPPSLQEREMRKIPVGLQEFSCTKEAQPTGTCSISGCGGAGTNLAPLMDPRFNLREAAKQMILLEDHLFHPDRQCQDCIQKHILTIEGFLEEGKTLDKERKYTSVFNSATSKFKEIVNPLLKKLQNKTISESDYDQVAIQLREMRKPLCQTFGSFCGDDN